MIRPRIVALALPLLAALPLTACHSTEAAPQTSTPAERVVDTVTVHREEKSTQLVLPAKIMAIPTSMVHIYPLISGRVLSLNILPGQEVHKGEKIGTLQSSDAAQARSDFEKAKIEAARADLQLARAQQLLSHEVMAQKDYDDLKAVDQADHAELERARQTLHILGFSENATSDVVPIVTPVSGVVLDVGTAPGELQRSLDNATAMATIADIDTIWVVGDLYPRDQSTIHAGEPVEITVTGYPGMTLEGTIDNISDSVDPVSLTLKVRVVLRNPGHKLKPQMYANISVTSQKRDVFVLPSSAVIQNGHATFVFVETATGKYERRDVILGTTTADSDEITQGLNEGDKVVSTGAELLRGAEGQ